ncbi:MAG: nucleotidyl transferase AbiEii/AbiGii toxin family protein [Pseudomonadota bacterium]|nr:nucleotidyl transferase AbiEii/AbiGii toxin family protein [Pseudomonadota bacterium]
MIPQSHISKLSNRLLKENGGRRIPEYVLERDYCIAWFLVGLSRVPLRNKIVFKGGTALRRCHFPEYRFSEDLDFTLLHAMPFDMIKAELESLYAEVKSASNITFQFSRLDSKTHRNSYTFYLKYEGPLPTASIAKEIKVDITISERVFYPSLELPVITTCDEFTDLPKNQNILVYSLPEIASEKTVALLDRARTEPRDLYDLWYLTEHSGSVRLEDCLEAINAKLTHRGKTLEEVCGEFHTKETRLNKTWESRLSMQMANTLEFDNIYRSVKRALRQANITHSR